MEWYSNDSKLTVGSSSATCTYDDGITLPNTPTVPTGYTFGGWQVRRAAASGGQQGAQTLLSAIGGTAPQYVHWYAADFRDNETCYFFDIAGSMPTETTCEDYDLSAGEWIMTLDIGIIKGEFSCEDYIFNCSCRVTGFKSPNSNSYTAITSSWVNVTSLDWCFDTNDSTIQSYGLNSAFCDVEEMCMYGYDGCHCIEDDDEDQWEDDWEPDDDEP